MLDKYQPEKIACVMAGGCNEEFQICASFDEECQDMTMDEANACYFADIFDYEGYCPILRIG